MRRTHPLALLGLLVTLCLGCTASPPRLSRRDQAVLALDLAHTRPAGRGRGYRPAPSGNSAAATGERVGWLSCTEQGHRSYGAHLELFAHNQGVVLPAGIGVNRALHPRCRYPLRTLEPTGVIQVDLTTARRGPTVADLFRLWGQPLSRHRMVSFHGSVTAFLDGRRWRDDPTRIPLRRHAQVVLELGPYVPPHASYLFPPDQ
jgi:hypothetical protein